MGVSEHQRSGLNAALRTLLHHYPVVLEKMNKIRPILTLKKMLWDFQIHLKPQFLHYKLDIHFV